MKKPPRPVSSSSGWRAKHSIIVIEHDMVFVRQIARKVTVLHQGHVLCEEFGGPGPERRTRHRSISGPEEEGDKPATGAEAVTP